MKRYVEYIVLVILISFVRFEATSGMIGSVTHTVTVQQHV
jgi:hypothetical protein